MKCLNIGCGKDYKDGWVNLDVQKGVKADVYADISKGLPFEDNTFDMVLANDVLEHFKEPVKVVEEVWRVLKPNGVFEFMSPFGVHLTSSFHLHHYFYLVPRSFECVIVNTRRFNRWNHENTARFEKDFFNVKVLNLPFWFPESFQYVNLFVDIVNKFKGRLRAIKGKR